LGRNNSGHASWVAIANEAGVAHLDFLNKIVSLNSNTAALTPSYSYLALSLVGGEANETVYGPTANQWANLIAGETHLNMEWFFFRSAGIWYIVWIDGADSTILQLQLNAAKNQYAWQLPRDASGVGVDTANWTKTFFQENGVWKVRFQAPNGRISFDAFIEKWNGRYIEYADPNSPYQCMDLMFQYNDEVLGIVGFGAPTAYEAYLKGDSRFDKIPNTGTNLPQKGDLVFWRQTDDNWVNKAGHVAMFIEGDRNRFSSFDQNWPAGSPSEVVEHRKWEWVAGWLHPK
jgi:hypothetical protein